MHRTAITMSIFIFAASGCALDAAIGDGEAGLDETLFVADNGIRIDNGLALDNGTSLPNGTKLSNGLKLSNGMDAQNGIKLSNGTKLSNGITGPYYAPPDGSALEQWIDVEPEMRKRILRYLVECALPDPIEVQILYRGQLEILGRGIGNLGPGLQQGEMSAVEQEKVSACLLARVNIRGQVVTIDMFGPMNDGLFDQAPAPDSPFAEVEGAFFGNLFLASPMAFACTADGGYELEEAACGLTRTCQPNSDGGCDCGITELIGSCDAGFTPLAKAKRGCTIWGDGFYMSCQGSAITWRYPMTTHVAL